MLREPSAKYEAEKAEPLTHYLSRLYVRGSGHHDAVVSVELVLLREEALPGAKCDAACQGLGKKVRIGAGIPSLVSGLIRMRGIQLSVER